MPSLSPRESARHLHVALLCVAVACFSTVATAYSYAPITGPMRTKAQRIISAALAPGNISDVYSRLGQLTDDYGPRFSGSQSLEDAIDWIVATAQRDSGYNVSTEPAMVPAWIRGNEWATLQIPTRTKKLHMVGLGMSNGTQGRTITAPVMVVKSYDDLMARAAEARGKVVMFNVPFTSYGATVQYRFSGANWTHSVGGVACVIRSVSTYSMQNTHTGSSMTAPVPALAVSVEDATQLQRLYDRGVPMNMSIYMEAHQVADRPSRNVVMEIRGATKPDEYVVFGGHVDSWDIAEGAMDDGGGIVSAWGAIRILASLGIRSERTIRAVMWTNEENGDRGGQAYARINAANLNKTSFAIETDEGAFSPWSISFTGHGAAYNQLYILRSLLNPLGSGNVTKGGGGTDIGPMCRTGVPCAGLETRDPRATNFSNNPCQGMLSAADYANPGLGSLNGISDGYFWFHHSNADTLDRMDPTQLQQVAATLAVWAVAVGDLPELLPRSGATPPLPPWAQFGAPPATPPPPPNRTGIAVGAAVGIVAVALVAGAVAFVVKTRVLRRRSAGLSDEDMRHLETN